MAGRGHQSFEKRQRERAKQERQAQKRERRSERKASKDDDGAEQSEDQLLEQFRVLSERHDRGEVEDDEFETQKAELFEKLGLASD